MSDDRFRRARPYLISGLSGMVAAWLVTGFVIFPGNVLSSDVAVPNVTGLPYAEAAARLKAAGLVAARGEQRFESSVPAGNVLDQTPDPSGKAPKGTEVTLDLSRGQQQVVVPRVAGMSQDQAQAAIEATGLTVGDVATQPNAAPLGQVLASVPVAGTQVGVPSPVALTVSSGPPMVDIPDVVGQDYTQARVLLGQLGFVVGTVTVDTSSTQPPNLVVGQQPAAASRARAGATINLVITTAP